PVEVIAVGTGSDQEGGRVILGQPLDESAVFPAVVLGDEFAAAAPALVADPPVLDLERLGVTVGCPFIRQRGRAGRCLAVLNPLRKSPRLARPDIGGQVSLDATEPAEREEFVRPELVGLGPPPPSAVPTRPTGRRPDPVSPVILVCKAPA